MWKREHFKPHSSHLNAKPKFQGRVLRCVITKVELVQLYIFFKKCIDLNHKWKNIYELLGENEFWSK